MTSTRRTDLISGAETRTVVLDALEDARAGFDGACPDANRFEWLGAGFYLDRVRGFVTPLRAAETRGFADQSTIPSGEFIVEVYGSRDQDLRGHQVRDFLAHVVADRLSRRAWSVVGAALINLLIAQPRINPGFDALVWLVLALDVRDGNTSSIHDVLAPMMIDLATYPASIEQADAARTAQAEFVSSFDTSRAELAAELDDASWAESLHALLDEKRALIERYVWDDIASRARSI